LFRIQALRNVAIEFLTTSSFIGDPARTPLAARLNTLSTALDKLQLKSNLSTDDLIKTVKDSFGGEEPGAVVKAKEYMSSVSNLKDSLLAIKRNAHFPSFLHLLCSSAFCSVLGFTPLNEWKVRY
jgi:hypothetical protein